MIVVSDTSPITALLAVGCGELLPQLFGDVVIPRAVEKELRRTHSSLPPWVRVMTVHDRAKTTLYAQKVDLGEAEAIALTQELSADLLLIDERIGRVIAARFGIKIIGLLGVVMEAKHRGLIREIKPLIDALTNVGFRIGNDLYERVLQAAGEQQS